jgi:anti-sigma factor RsiW
MHPALPLIVEVETLDQLDEALREGCDRILIDEFDAQARREAVRRAASPSFNRSIPLEVSGVVDLETVRANLASIPVVCAGGPAAGPIGKLSARERFHWLVAPRSTIIQTSPVHSGRCQDPAAALDHLVRTMVLARP